MKNALNKFIHNLIFKRSYREANRYFTIFMVCFCLGSAIFNAIAKDMFSFLFWSFLFSLNTHTLYQNIKTNKYMNDLEATNPEVYKRLSQWESE